MWVNGQIQDSWTDQRGVAKREKVYSGISRNLPQLVFGLKPAGCRFLPALAGRARQRPSASACTPANRPSLHSCCWQQAVQCSGAAAAI